MSGTALLIAWLGVPINFVLSRFAGIGAAMMVAARARADKIIETECMMVGESMLLVGCVNALPSRFLLRCLH